MGEPDDDAASGSPPVESSNGGGASETAGEGSDESDEGSVPEEAPTPELEEAEPPPIEDPRVVFNACEAVDPCGGELEGQWRYVESCLDTAALGVDDTIEELCAEATLRSLSGEVSGTLTFAGGEVRREGRSVARGLLDVPQSCLSGLVQCSFLPLVLAQPGVDVDNCVPADGGCTCEVVVESNGFGPLDFSAQGGVLSLTEPSAELSYCVQGDTLAYDAAGFEPEPGIHRLVRVD